MSRAGLSGDAGFTLIEVLLALTVLSLAALILGPQITGSVERDGVTRTLALLDTVLTSARAKAQQGRTVFVMLDLDERRIHSSIENRWHPWPSYVGIDTWTARELGSPRQPVIAFLADGTSSGARIRVRAGSQEGIRNIAWLTGAITHGE
jgi:general secretion pathway protein H